MSGSVPKKGDRTLNRNTGKQPDRRPPFLMLLGFFPHCFADLPRYIRLWSEPLVQGRGKAQGEKWVRTIFQPRKHNGWEKDNCNTLVLPPAFGSRAGFLVGGALSQTQPLWNAANHSGVFRSSAQAGQPCLGEASTFTASLVTVAMNGAFPNLASR